MNKKITELSLFSGMGGGIVRKMHIETGRMISDDEYEALKAEQQRAFVRGANSPQEAKERLITLDGERKNWMKNKDCPCGSGKKFKKYHWNIKKAVA